MKWVGIAITILAAGCVPGPTINSGNTGASAAAASSAGASSGASGSGTGMTSSGEAATSSTTASGASSSGGTATGFVGSSSAGSTTGIPISPPIDGGYVFCSGFGGEDAGSWMCTPGTYFCDWNGYPGYCFQCRSDADCSDPHLPTYDPRKPRCDLSSGIFGYQNFCQQCLSDADCASNLAAPFCDVSPTLSAGFSHTIDNLGFESCDRTETDCRADGGPPCGLNALCNADSGACEVRSLACTSDADCVGLFADTNHTMAYCFDGACTQYAGGGYPGPCNTNAECGNPGGLFDGGMVCSFGLCQCTDDSQCQGATPVCQNFGSTSVCGCETDQQCGDGGLHCFYGDTGGSFCGVSCNSPAAPPCSTDKPNCNQDSGTCGYCTADSDCQTVFSPAGNACGPYGECGCRTNADCPGGQICYAGQNFGSCGVALAGCDPSTCLSDFCDWDAGACVGLSAAGFQSCITDYDCHGFDRCVAGSCAECIDDNDCIEVGLRTPGQSFGTRCSSNRCTTTCAADSDCIDNPLGPSCLIGSSGVGECQSDYCHTNSDCALNWRGHYCDLDAGGFDNDPGTCHCTQNSDCGPGNHCQTYPGALSYCIQGCESDSDCPTGKRCDPNGTCREHCDDGGTCGVLTPACDTANAGGENGQTVQGADPSVVWCLTCLTSADCPNGEACDPQYGGSCTACTDNSQCASGPCVNETCLTACGDGGNCGAGMVCDTQNSVGQGANMCYQCISPIDCPNGEGCNSRTHLCGSCNGPSVVNAASDCPPGDVCSNYWSPLYAAPTGVCLARCVAQSCPADRPICAIFPSLSQELPFCFGCLSDADCAGDPPGTWCDTSINLTFECQPPAGP